MSASLLLIVVVVGLPAVGPCREPCSVVAGWLWGLCRSHCYCGAASAPLSHSHQAALPHSFLPAPPVFTLDQSGGRSLPHSGQSPPCTPLPTHSRGVQSRHEDTAHPVGTEPSPFPCQSSAVLGATAEHCAPLQQAAQGPQSPPPPPRDNQGGKKTRRNSIPALLLSMHDSRTGPNSHLGAQQSSPCPGKKGFRR